MVEQTVGSAVASRAIGIGHPVAVEVDGKTGDGAKGVLLKAVRSDAHAADIGLHEDTGVRFKDAVGLHGGVARRLLKVDADLDRGRRTGWIVPHDVASDRHAGEFRPGAGPHAERDRRISNDIAASRAAAAWVADGRAIAAGSDEDSRLHGRGGVIGRAEANGVARNDCARTSDADPARTGSEEVALPAASVSADRGVRALNEN